MNPAEVVAHEMERDGVLEALDLLRERVGQAGESAHAHPHCQVVPLGVARGDMVGIGVGRDDFCPGPDAVGRAIADFAVLRSTVELDQHGVINICPEGILDSREVGFMPVRGELNPIRQPSGQAANELEGVSRFPTSQHGTSFVSALMAVQIQTSPYPNFPLYSSGAFCSLA